MTEEEADGWLLSRELFGIRPGLERVRALLHRLGDPQRAFDAVHVVGSNGKTSTSTMAAALLERRGIRSGAYVSPHLVGFRERVQLAGEPAPADVFADAVARVRATAEAMEREGSDASAADPVTQFEAVTAAGLLVLASSGVEVAVLEAGLGGRWDATNVLPRDAGAPGRAAGPGAAAPADRRPRVAVLTSIALEHQRWLGSTITEIATEKVEVLRPGGVLVLGPGLPADAVAVARRVVADRGATCVEAPDDPDVPTPGAARYQRRNLATASTAVDALLGGHDHDALRGVAARIVVPGRYEAVASRPTVLHDGAHNPAGAEALAETLEASPPARPLVLLAGVLDDKDAGAMLRALSPHVDAVVATAPSGPRALAPERLAATASDAVPGRPVEVAEDPHRGLERARMIAGPGGTVLCTGSLHLVADLRRGPGAPPGSSL